MAQVITVRRLVTELVLRSKPAERALAAYDKLWKGVAKGAQDAAKAVNAAADGMASTVDRMATAARSAGARAGAAGRGGGGRSGGRGGPDPIDAAMRRASVAEAASAGMRDGAASITKNTEALKKNATATDKSVAKIKDLTAQVDRNRKEQQSLRKQILTTGDATGTLAARSKGLAVATSEANLALAQERRNLREVSGTAGAAAKVLGHLGKITGGVGGTLRSALGVAGGNLISSAAARITQGIGGSFVGATKAAIDFESAMADVRKVLPTDTTAEQFKAIEEGVIGISRRVAVAPTELAALTASLAQAGIAGQELNTTAEDAAKLAVAFGISGEEAGTAIAKMRTGLGLNREEVNLLTGSINQLGNNMAATAPQILDVVRRVGAVGKSANLSKEQVAGLGAALVAGGAESEVAATGLKNFTIALASGDAATKKQMAAFQALGMSAADVAKEFTSGDLTRSNAIIRKVVSSIGELADDAKVSTIKNLFGSESLGAIGPLATQVDLFDRAMGLATDQVAAAGSVQKEYDTRSKTTANSIQLLKNNVEALAIKFGTALLPYIEKIVAFLTSEEGQKWGADAVEKAVAVVTGFADAVGKASGVLGKMIELFGGATTAAGLLGFAVLGLRGPFGLALAAGIAMGAGIGSAISSVVNRAENAAQALMRLRHAAADIEHKEAQDAADASQKERGDIVDANMAQLDRERRAKAATDKWERQEKAKLGDNLTSADSRRIGAKAIDMRRSMLRGTGGGSGNADDRIAAFEASLRGGGGGGGGGDKSARFQQLLATREARQLKPSEAMELGKLSRSLDIAIPKKQGGGGGRGGKGREHKQTKMDKGLSGLDADLADVLTRGGELDAGGDAKVSGDVLSRGVFARATGAAGGGGIGGVGSVGPGPNITNNYYNTTVTVQQAIDARSSAPVPQNIRDAAHEAGTRVGEQAVKFTGANRVAALRNSGGRLAGA